MLNKILTNDFESMLLQKLPFFTGIFYSILLYYFVVQSAEGSWHWQNQFRSSSQWDARHFRTFTSRYYAVFMSLPGIMRYSCHFQVLKWPNTEQMGKYRQILQVSIAIWKKKIFNHFGLEIRGQKLGHNLSWAQLKCSFCAFIYAHQWCSDVRMPLLLTAPPHAS